MSKDKNDLKNSRIAMKNHVKNNQVLGIRTDSATGYAFCAVAISERLKGDKTI
jgi:hypothetical protein